MTALEALRHSARDIFKHALAACDISTAFDRHLRFEGTTLVRHASSVAVPLGGYKDIFVIGFGKAALPMLDALLERIPKQLPVHGVCSAPVAPCKRHRHIQYFMGGHPLPNEDSFAAAHVVLELLKQAHRDTFIFFLISGGGSAMLELPLAPHISLDDTVAFHATLIASGATITEINTVRKYFSAVKGGRLAQAAPGAEKLTLLVADVPLEDLGSVASSPTLPDHSTPAQCAELLDRYRLFERFPASVREHFQSLPGRTPESDSEAHFDTLLSSDDFLNAARGRAHALGFKVIIDNACDDWDYADASRYLLKRFHQLRARFPRLCLLSTGEVTVKLEPEHGCGGRNQQFALLSAFDLAQYEDQTLVVLSVGSDGIDGNSPAAGALADTTTIARAQGHRFDASESLARFDSFPLFTALGDSIVTGTTGNNLRDLRVLLAARK